MGCRRFAVLVAACLALALSMTPVKANADTGSVRRTTAPDTRSWCAAGVETLPGDVCYLDGRTKAPRRTLVIWLHGVIGQNTTMSWAHEKMLQNVAKATGIEMLFPKGIAQGTLYAWPGTTESREKNEAALITQWMNAKTVLEKRENRNFDEVFVFGFSSGAYFTSSLAMRGRVDVDGYATFAGGQSQASQASPVARFAPVFVGVCAKDKSTAQHSRAFAASLATAGMRRMVNEQPVGHDLSASHFIKALAFLRAQTKTRTAPPA